MPAVQRRIQAAEKVDDVERKTRKTSSHNSWYKKQAEDMDIVLDEDWLKDEGDANDEIDRKIKVKALRATLKSLLAAPLDDGRGGPGGGKGKLQISRGKVHRRQKFGSEAGAAINVMKTKKLKRTAKSSA